MKPQPESGFSQETAMEFLKFLARRLNVSTGEAAVRLEHALDNYRPAREYSIHVLDARGSGHRSSGSADSQS